MWFATLEGVYNSLPPIKKMKRQTPSSDIISCLAFLQWITMRSMTQFTRSLYTSFINYQLAGVCQAVGFNHRGEHHGSGLQNEKRRSMTEFSYRTIELHQHFLPVLMKRADLSPSMVLHYQRGRETYYYLHQCPLEMDCETKR